MNFEQAPEDFGYVVFDRTDRDADARRFYMIAWQPTLLDDGAVVRTFGRKGRWRRVITTPYHGIAAVTATFRSSPGATCSMAT